MSILMVGVGFFSIFLLNDCSKKETPVVEPVVVNPPSSDTTKTEPPMPYATT
jgi:hypothetical protein